MTTSIYMKVTPSTTGVQIRGGSTERNHVDWFDVASFSSGVETATNLAAGGWSVGKPAMTPISVVVNQQQGLADVWALPLQGRASTILVEIWQRFGQGMEQVERRSSSYEFTNAFFTKVATLEDVSAADDVWRLEFRYATIALNQFNYAPANRSATPTSTRRVTYNVATNVTAVS